MPQSAFRGQMQQTEGEVTGKRLQIKEAAGRGCVSKEETEK